MNVHTLKALIGRLNGNAFIQFLHTFFDLTYGSLKQNVNFGNNNELCSNLFKVLVDDANNPPTCSFRNYYFYVPLIYPLDLINDIKKIKIELPGLLNILDIISNNYLQWKRDVLPKKPHDDFRVNAGELIEHVYLLMNLSNINKEDYFKHIIPKYEKLLVGLKFDKSVAGIGSVDSFCERNYFKTVEAFDKFVNNNYEGLCISVNEDNGIGVDRYCSQKYLENGVTGLSKTPIEPVILLNQSKEEILVEFERLINTNAKECQIESFLKKYFREVFGCEYDRIETQVWIKLKEFGYFGKNRKLDVFLRNSLLNDWELIELKRPKSILSNYRDINVFSGEVYKAIEQVRLYNRYLQNDRIKKYFSSEGIDYIVPELKLVIGKKPQISIEDWRYLLKSNDKDVKIITYDTLLSAMKFRAMT